MGKPKRFRFNSEADELLATVVVQIGTHNANHGETEEKFNEVLKTFCLSPVFLSMKEKFAAPEPKRETLRNRFNLLVDKHRTANKADIGASGIEREYTELDMLLDNAIEDIDTKKQVSQETKAAKENYLKNVVSAGGEIRELAMKTYLDTPEDESDTANTPRRNKLSHQQTFDTELQLVEEDIKHRREHESKKLALDEHRLALDEKRFESEREDRRIAQESQKANISLMHALVSKLTE